MGFDPIIGMGRSPMVTQDFITDPLGVGYDVTYLSQPFEQSLQMSPSGSLLAPINPNFDYLANNPYKMERNGTTQTNIFGYNYNKVIIMNSINILYSASAVGATCNILIDISADGVNYETIENTTLTAGNSLSQKLVIALNKKVRTIRFTIQLAAVGITNSDFTLQKIEVKSDPYQY